VGATRGAAPAEVAASLSPALRAKVQEVASGLSQEEATQLRRLLDGAGVDEAGDVEGYAVGLIEGDAGNKGRLHTQTPPTTVGGNPIGFPLFLVGVVVLGSIDGGNGHPGPPGRI
jgi:hypothetical protein